MKNINFDKNYFLIILIPCLVLGYFYSITIAPSISWANHSADSGELIAAIATGGIAHPPGYPTYLIVGRLFQLLPFSDLAFRTNLLSAVAAIGASVIVGCVVYVLINKNGIISAFVGIISGVAFGLSSLFWSQAVVTEVYTLFNFLLILGMYLLILSVRYDKKWLYVFAGLIWGLGVGAHMTMLLFIPSTIFFFFEPVQGRDESENRRQDSWNSIKWKCLGEISIGFILGLLVFIILIPRAQSGSPVIWGYPITIKRFWWLVSAKMYRGGVLALPIEYIWQRIRAIAVLLLDQYGLIGMAIGVYGLFYSQLCDQRLRYISLWTFSVFSIFAIGYNYDDSMLLLLPAFMFFGVWIGLGLNHTIEKIKGFKVSFSIEILVLLFAGVLVVGRAWTYIPKIDASKNYLAEQYGKGVMEIAPERAIIFTQMDEDGFVLWYFQYALKERPDLVLIHKGLIDFEWYRDLLYLTYPGLIIPEEPGSSWLYAFGERNVNRPICETFIEGEKNLVCTINE